MSFNDHPLLESQFNQISVLLAPLRDGSIILPSVSVAEIVQNVTVVPLEKPSRWLTGTVTWRDQVLPVVDFEALVEGNPLTEIPCLMVVNSVGISKKSAFFAIAINAIPTMEVVEEDNVKLVSSAQSCYLDGIIRLGQHNYWLPSLEMIETECVNLLE